MIARLKQERLMRDQLAQQQAQHEANLALNRDKLSAETAQSQAATDVQRNRLDWDQRKGAADWFEKVSTAPPSQLAASLPAGRLLGITAQMNQAAPQQAQFQLPDPQQVPQLADPMAAPQQPQARLSPGAHLRPPAATGMATVEASPEERARAAQRISFMRGNEPIGSIDLGRNADTLRDVGDTIVRMARTPAEAAILRAMRDAAVQSSDYQKPDEAMRDAGDMAKFQLGESGKDRRQQFAGQMAQGRMDLQSMRDVVRYRNDYVRTAIRNMDVVAHNRTITACTEMLGLLSLDNPLGDRAAFTRTLKAMFSSVTSNTELTYAQQAGGVENQIETEALKWIDQGRIPDEYKTWLMEVSEQSLDEAEGFKLQAAKSAYEGVMNDWAIGQILPSPESRAQLANGAAQMVLTATEGADELPDAGQPMLPARGRRPLPMEGEGVEYEEIEVP